MHSPIIYAVIHSDDSELNIFDLNNEEEKQQFMDDQFPDRMELEFDSWVPMSDWWVINSTDQEGWHRGEWEVKALIEEELEQLLGKAPGLSEEKPGVWKLSITKEDAAKYYLERLDNMQRIVAEADDIDRTDMKAVRRKIQEIYWKLSEVKESSIKIMSLFGNNEAEIMNMGDVFDYASYSGDIDVYIYTSIQGDYHY